MIRSGGGRRDRGESMATREEIATALGSKRCRKCGGALSYPEYPSDHCHSCLMFLLGKFIEEHNRFMRDALNRSIEKLSLWSPEKK